MKTFITLAAATMAGYLLGFYHMKHRAIEFILARELAKMSEAESD